MVRRKLLALTAAGALVLAACGDDDDAESTEPAGTEAPVDTEAPADTEAPVDTETTEPMTTESVTTEPMTTEATDTTEAGGGEAFAVDVEACEDPDAATAPIEGDILIGQSIPLSGGPAVLFAPFGAGFEAYLDFYNDTNGGVDGHLLQAVIKDDQYSADITRANVDELVFDEGVHVLSGVIGTPNNAAIQADMNAQCIPQLWASTGAPNWGDVENNPWTSGLLVPYPVEVEAFLTYAAEQFPGGGTAAIFYVNTEFGQAYAEALNERASEFGFEVVAEETIDAADSGAPSGQMTNLVAADPDIIIAVPLGAQCIAFMTELGNAKASSPDFDPLVYQTATCANPIFFGAVSNGGNDGVYTSSNVQDVNNAEVAATNESVQAYLDAFAASGSDADPGGIAIAGWIAAELTAHVLEQAAATGTLSRESIINAVRNIDYVPSLAREGLTFQMDATDGYIAEGTQIQQWSVDANDGQGGFVDVGEVINLEDFLGTATD